MGWRQGVQLPFARTALTFYASVLMEIRRISAVKESEQFVGKKTRSRWPDQRYQPVSARELDIGKTILPCQRSFERGSPVGWHASTDIEAERAESIGWESHQVLSQPVIRR